jgi:hypothetical protein
MEEGVLDIKLVNGPVPGVSQSKDSTNGGGLDDGTECLVVIHSGALCEATKNPPRFVSVKGAIGMELVPKNPLSSNNVGLNWALDKIPGLICIKSSTFFFHCLAPIGVCQSITVGTRNRGEYLGVQGGTGLLEPGLAARAHAVGVDNRWDGDGARRKGGP